MHTLRATISPPVNRKQFLPGWPVETWLWSSCSSYEILFYYVASSWRHRCFYLTSQASLLLPDLSRPVYTHTQVFTLWHFLPHLKKKNTTEMTQSMAPLWGWSQVWPPLARPPRSSRALFPFQSRWTRSLSPQPAGPSWRAASQSQPVAIETPPLQAGLQGGKNSFVVYFWRWLVSSRLKQQQLLRRRKNCKCHCVTLCISESLSQELEDLIYNLNLVLLGCILSYYSTLYFYIIKRKV